MKRVRHSSSRRTFATSGLAALATLYLPALPGAQQMPASAGRSISREEEQKNVAVVNDFCAAFLKKDLAKAVSLLADNCTYRTTQTRPAISGKEKVSETIKGFLERGAEFKVLKTVVLGPVVLNERDDIIKRADGGTSTFRVAAGFFFVENGKIVEWTDYVIR